MENSNFIQNPEWTDLINASAKELYDILVTVYEDYYQTSASSTPITDTIPLPAGFYKLLGVDQYLSGSTGQTLSLKPYSFPERNSYIPYASTTTTFNLYFIPIFAPLILDTDTFDGVNGWEEYIVCDVAAKALEKEESDPNPQLKRKADLHKRIMECAPNRDAGTSARVIDVGQVNPYSYIAIPAQYRYKILGNNLKLVQAMAAGTVYP